MDLQVIRCAEHTDYTCWENRSWSCNTNLHTLKIPGWHFGRCLAFWFVLSKSLPAVSIRTEWADNTQMSCPTLNPKQQLTGLLYCLTSYSKHDGWLTHLSYLGPLSLSVPSSPLSVTSTRAGIGLNTPIQRKGRGCQIHPEQVNI